MNGSKPIAWVVAALAVASAYGFSLNEARAEDVPEPVVPQESTAPNASDGAAAKPTPPRSPIRIETVDYQEKGDGPGKLKLAGTAKPGTTVYVFVDDQPYVKLLADEKGNWNVEGDLELTGNRHVLRAEQYDKDTRMLAGRAMVTIGRNKVNAEP